jgi:signal transduction histidine kinase
VILTDNTPLLSETDVISTSPLLHDLLDHSNNVIMVLAALRDGNGKITDFTWVYANRKASLLTGTEISGLIGNSLLKTPPESLFVLLFDQYVQVVESGQTCEHDFSFEHGKFSRRWVHSTIRRFEDGVAVTLQDITDRKKEIQKTKRLNHQLKYSNAQKDKLFSIIAHDFRSPFAGCLGMLEMVLEDRDAYEGEELYEMLMMIYRQSQSTYQLLESLLDWAMIQQNQLNYFPEKTNLFTLTDLMLKMHEGYASDKKIRLINNIPADAFAYADRHMLKTVLRNLISNGIKFTNPEGEIFIGFRKKGSFAEISVTDNGIGIQKLSQQKIFNIDYQYIGKGTHGEKGTGIGLHVCRDFIHRHGGVIEVESMPGSGSTFRFTLPLRKPEEI